MERFIVGASEATEAEYAFRDTLFDKPFTVLILDENNDCFSCEGFDTMKEALTSLSEVPRNQIEIL
ncbi:hypothetical protein [Rhizobium leucaenae]|uniref:hypothetical protein n=1 Tax=Rhizobium leucaenae TaxID=29450 RepID=UPI00160BB75D|nr:hypothetical protein [Rhizobium leucaenae]MBB6299922.1 hypothetical protein [Rhizobium leucaenae]